MAGVASQHCAIGADVAEASASWRILIHLICLLSKAGSMLSETIQ
jgi:hypothetical protein